MSCCDNQMTPAEHDELHVDQCPECGYDVDEDGITVELDDCNYSPILCSKCGYRPCNGSC